MNARKSDVFVISGTAAAIERMGAVTRSRLYRADEFGALTGEVALAEGVKVRRIRNRAPRGSRDEPVTEARRSEYECASRAVASMDIAARLRLRDMVMDALASS